MEDRHTRSARAADEAYSEPPDALLCELVDHLRQNRTHLREEWARRSTRPHPVNATLRALSDPLLMTILLYPHGFLCRDEAEETYRVRAAHDRMGAENHSQQYWQAHSNLGHTVCDCQTRAGCIYLGVAKSDPREGLQNRQLAVGSIDNCWGYILAAAFDR